MQSVRPLAQSMLRVVGTRWLACCACAALLAACATAAPTTEQPIPLGSPSDDAWSPTANPARGPSVVGLNSSCESCHTEIAKEWRGSLHQLAYVEPAYQRALAREPLAWCRRCHAPEADSRSEPPAALAALGVGCVTCHVVDDQILAGAARADSGTLGSTRQFGSSGAGASAAHPVLRSLATSPAGACKNCHEFAFPDSALRQRPLLMQSTVSEHAASDAAAQSCADCHMPATGVPGARSHRDHRFAASRDPDLLRRSLTASVERAAGVMRFRLGSQGVGHAFPTGDLFRRLEVGVEVVGDDYRVLQRKTELLTRHFKASGTGGFAHRVLVSDTRIGPTAQSGGDAPSDTARGERQVEIRIAPGPGARAIAWWVSYQRVAFPRAGDQDAEIEGDVILASGVLALDEQAGEGRISATP